MARVALLLVALLVFTLPALAWVNVAGPACGTTVRADTEFSAQHSGAKATDGSLERGTGCWYSRDQSTLPCALTFQLAGVTDLRAVVVHQANWGGNMYHTRAFAVETSTDGTQWQRVATGELPDANLTKQEVPLTNVHTQWLRIVVLTSYNSFQTCGLAEVELLAAGIPEFSAPQFDLNGRTDFAATSAYCGFAVAGDDTGPQLALVATPPGALAALRRGERMAISLKVSQLERPGELVAGFTAGSTGPVEVTLSAGPASRRQTLAAGMTATVRVAVPATQEALPLRVEARALTRETTLSWHQAQLEGAGVTRPVQLLPTVRGEQKLPPPPMPALRPAIERALIEHDWRMQDGIGTPRLPVTYAAALGPLLDRGAALLRDLRESGLDVAAEARQWRKLRDEAGKLGPDDTPAAEALWRRAHWLRREVALRNPLFPREPLVFAQQVPGAFSHQLTQYYGRYARPGGGISVLPAPGRSMQCRSLTAGKLPAGSFQHPELSFDGKRLLFSYCQAETPPQDTRNGQAGRFFHLYEMAADGSGLKQLTDGAFDDFAPRYLPDGRLLLISTRRQGWHRCGSPGCENYTLTVAQPDGTGLRSISYHETQEWDPALLHDGRIVYTRWDYVDRNAVFYEQLWTTGLDGTRPSIFFGNNTFNPVGIWEPQAVPGSRRVMATAAAHHAMTAGSIILVDVAAGVDGKDPIIRLTPDVPFPEGEIPTAPAWFSAKREPRATPENDRWPGHCYRSPFPLSERYFLAAYSFEGLVGEAQANVPNMFGLYFVDSFGNRELLYRDLEVSSAWPVPLRARPKPAAVPLLAEAPEREGTFVLQDVYAAAPALPAGAVKWLRVLQVLPKSTPGIDNPPVGLPRGAPGKQVLGTVPVEADGSAHFRAPAGVPLAFQALDGQRQALQVMRSLTYLQPGETVTCVGCHESRVTAPPVRRASAAARAPSPILPAPEGARPFSYPRLVQPVLDRACVRCHSGDQAPKGLRLTGEPEGHYTRSYNALAPRVPYSDQGSLESLSLPGQYGARGSQVMPMLLAGHQGIKLTADEIERLVTWMDANALFYGTFDPEDQARQQRGEVIAGPKLQ